MSAQPVIVAAARSPIGRAFKGSLQAERPDDLLVATIGAALEKVPELDPLSIDDILVGCGSPAAMQGFNIARVASVLLGLDSVPGVTVNRYCASSIQTARMAAHAIRAREGEIFIAAGVESVSSYAVGDADEFDGSENPRFESAIVRSALLEQTNDEWSDPRDWDSLPDVYIAMGQTAENVATYCQVSRHEMDEYAVESQSRTARAAERGFWDKDITPYALADGSIMRADDSPRPSTSLEGLSELEPVFRKKGTVTAGNSCPLSDGAAALVVMSESKAKQLGLMPLARIISTAVTGVSPEIMGLGPVDATRKALKLAKLRVQDIDQFEINEAFAAQVVASSRELGIDPSKLNINGGAISIGHPFGSTGARITTTLIHSLQERDQELGVVSMCVAGGQGAAMVIQRLN